MSEIPTVRLVRRADPADAIVVNLEDEALYADRYCRPEQLEREQAAIEAAPDVTPEVAPEVTPEVAPQVPQPAGADVEISTGVRGRRRRYGAEG